MTRCSFFVLFSSEDSFSFPVLIGVGEVTSCVRNCILLVLGVGGELWGKEEGGWGNVGVLMEG